jgi:hypothetical protein
MTLGAVRSRFHGDDAMLTHPERSVVGRDSFALVTGSALGEFHVAIIDMSRLCSDKLTRDYKKSHQRDTCKSKLFFHRVLLS